MAVVDVSLVAREIRVLADSSQGAKKAVRAVLQSIENNPNAFEGLKFVPEEIDRALFERGAFAKKAKVIGKNFDFRLLFLYFVDEDRVIVFDAFPRKNDYQIDWLAMLELIGLPPCE